MKTKNLNINKIEMMKFNHTLKKDLMESNYTYFKKRTLLVRDNVAFLWDLKNKFLDKAHKLQLEKIDYAKSKVKSKK